MSVVIILIKFDAERTIVCLVSVKK